MTSTADEAAAGEDTMLMLVLRGVMHMSGGDIGTVDSAARRHDGDGDTQDRGAATAQKARGKARRNATRARGSMAEKTFGAGGTAWQQAVWRYI